MLKLSKVNGKPQVLSREELKKIKGGGEGENPGESCPAGMDRCFCNGIFFGCVFGPTQCFYTCHP